MEVETVNDISRMMCHPMRREDVPDAVARQLCTSLLHGQKMAAVKCIGYNGKLSAWLAFLDNGNRLRWAMLEKD